MALLCSRRRPHLSGCGQALQQSIYDSSGMEQVCRRRENGRLGIGCSIVLVARGEVSPFGGDQRAAAIGQHEEQMQTITAMDPSEDR
jgi:hypothetical protein